MKHSGSDIFQLGEASADEVFRIRYSPLSLTGPATTLRVASTQALRSRCVSSASKLSASCDPKPVRPVLQTGQAGFGQTATLGLWPRLCGSAE
jgi:hypothetical protein